MLEERITPITSCLLFAIVVIVPPSNHIWRSAAPLDQLHVENPFFFLNAFHLVVPYQLHGAVSHNRPPFKIKRNQHYITFGIILQIRDITHTLNWLSKTGPAH